MPAKDFEEALANPVAPATADAIIAAHEAKTQPPTSIPPAEPKPLWSWGDCKTSSATK